MSKYRADTISTWDEGACVIYLMQNDAKVPSKLPQLKSRHYIKYLRSICKRDVAKKTAEAIERCGLPNKDELIKQALASVYASVCEVCEERVDVGHRCKCGAVSGKAWDQI